MERIDLKFYNLFAWVMADKPDYHQVVYELEQSGLTPFIFRKMIRKDSRSITLSTKEKDKMIYVYLPFKGNGKFVKAHAAYEEKTI